MTSGSAENLDNPTSIQEMVLAQSGVEIVAEQPLSTGYVRVEALKYRLNGGSENPYTASHCKNGIVAVLYDPDTDLVLLKREFRLPTLMRSEEQWSQVIENSAGHRFLNGWMRSFVMGAAKDGENFDDVAVRETQEETHYDLGSNPQFVKGDESFINPAISSDFVIKYCFRFDSTKTMSGLKTGVQNEGEQIVTEVISVSELRDLLKEKQLGKTMGMVDQATAWWFLSIQPDLKKQWLGMPSHEPVLIDEARPVANDPALYASV